MVRVLADEQIDDAIVRGCRLREPAFDIVHAIDEGLACTKDPDLLAWAADHDRIVLSFDRNTMTDYAIKRVTAGLPMPGVFIASDRDPVRLVIDELILIYTCSEQSEWAGQIRYIPLRPG